MPESGSDPNNGKNKSSKRNLPSWMGSKEGGGENSGKKKHTNTQEHAQKGPGFSKLLDGVIFVLSGFVNPERSTLRSQALDMGAEYRPDWMSDCTLLVCAFANTPKFRQVESENGTIISKEWISECHSQRKLVDIEPYLMHAGKPWRRNKKPVEPNQALEHQKKQHKEHQKQVEQSHVKAVRSAVTEPEANELRAIAAEGIITCLQDAIESLEQGNDVKRVADQWKFVPQVINELAELDGRRKEGSLSKEQLSQLATKFKKIYQAEFDHLDSDSKKCMKRSDGPENEHRRKTKSDDAQYDSDDTIEMTEEEIDLACRHLPRTSG